MQTIDALVTKLEAQLEVEEWGLDEIYDSWFGLDSHPKNKSSELH